jgi:hypothetical protein
VLYSEKNDLFATKALYGTAKNNENKVHFFAIREAISQGNNVIEPMAGGMKRR